MALSLSVGGTERPNVVLRLLLTIASITAGCGTTNVETPAKTAIRVETPPIVVIGSSFREKEPFSSPDELDDTTEVIAPVAKSGLQPGQFAPHIVAEFVSGIGPTTIEEARGKVVLVDFWATFCAPCLHSFPKYQALVDQFGGNLVVVAISVDDRDTDKVQLDDFIEVTGVRFSVLWDKEQETARAYQLTRMPSSFIVDQGGIIRHLHGGYSRDTIEEMGRQIKALLAK